jgi:FlaA1/EpsC-like NDP-sugar epimerase
MNQDGGFMTTASTVLPAGNVAWCTAGRWTAAALETMRRQRRAVSLASFGSAAAAAYLVAFWAHLDFAWPTEYRGVLLPSLALLLVVRVAAAQACGLSTHRWRYVGASDVRRLVLAVGGGTVVLVPLSGMLGFTPPLPGAVLLLEPLLTLVFSAGLWLSYRTVYEAVCRSDSHGDPIRKVLVVGAGEAGEALVRQMITYPSGYRPVAFADDDPARKGTSIHGVRVLGATRNLAEIAAQCGAEEIVIALPSVEPPDLRRIVEFCEPTGLPFRVLPHIAQVLDGDVSLSQLRRVQIEDLLGREPVALELPELARDLDGRAVLITGAAGSIGSELARQVARNGPRKLVLVDQSETGLFFVDLELRDLAPNVEIVGVVADIVDAAAMERAFAVHHPDHVYHAAAYKHVPMMESNEREALRNNIVGTWRVAAAAGRHGAKRFVLVSTDKAVRPASVMGATKRAAELVILELQRAYPHTAFGAVRFGNVLGSAGSVVPIFKRLLEAGKPLTVTDEDATRYFMTIPEAAQLVLQASLLPEFRGRIAMLDMGHPVRILDLARTLIRLSGGGRGREPIVFTGLRPGEKLHEELVAPEERASPTQISKVNVLQPDGSARKHGLLERLDEWDRLLAAWQPDPVMSDLMNIVPELRARRSTKTPEVPAVKYASPVETGRNPSRGGLVDRAPARRRPLPTMLGAGAPGFIERRHRASRPTDTSKVPRRRATDVRDAGEFRGAAPA